MKNKKRTIALVMCVIVFVAVGQYVARLYLYHKAVEPSVLPEAVNLYMTLDVLQVNLEALIYEELTETERENSLDLVSKNNVICRMYWGQLDSSVKTIDDAEMKYFFTE